MSYIFIPWGWGVPSQNNSSLSSPHSLVPLHRDAGLTHLPLAHEKSSLAQQMTSSSPLSQSKMASHTQADGMHLSSVVEQKNSLSAHGFTKSKIKEKIHDIRNQTNEQVNKSVVVFCIVSSIFLLISKIPPVCLLYIICN